jgi:hypothetical protein
MTQPDATSSRNWAAETGKARVKGQKSQRAGSNQLRRKVRDRNVSGRAGAAILPTSRRSERQKNVRLFQHYLHQRAAPPPPRAVRPSLGCFAAELRPEAKDQKRAPFAARLQAGRHAPFDRVGEDVKARTPTLTHPHQLDPRMGDPKRSRR